MRLTDERGRALLDLLKDYAADCEAAGDPVNTAGMTVQDLVMDVRDSLPGIGTREAAALEAWGVRAEQFAAPETTMGGATMPSAYSVVARWHGDRRGSRLAITGEPANRMHALVTVDRIAAETWADRIATDPAIADVYVIDAETGRRVMRDA